MRVTVWPSCRRTFSMEGTAHAKTLRQEWIGLSRSQSLKQEGIMTSSTKGSRQRSPERRARQECDGKCTRHQMCVSEVTGRAEVCGSRGRSATGSQLVTRECRPGAARVSNVSSKAKIFIF